VSLVAQRHLVFNLKNNNPVIKLNYHYSGAGHSLLQISEDLQIPLCKNELNFPVSVGQGSIRLVNLDNGIHATISDCQFTDDCTITLKKSADQHYFLQFYEITESAENSDAQNGNNNAGQFLFAGIHLACSIFERSYFLKKGRRIRTIKISLDKDMMARYLGVTKKGNAFSKYLMLKEVKQDFEIMDEEYKKIFDGILIPGDQPLKSVYLQNRILELLEKYFTGLYQKVNSLEHKIRVTDDELNRLMNVEFELLQDFTTPALTIDQLSKMAAMSPTKLKISFKSIYGLPIYEYYQKHRMQKARELLLSGRYLVKEAGQKIGYQNVSHFAFAFKKEFNILPSELLMERAGKKEIGQR
jgi:AraC-like DNA-binding protein